MLLISQHPLSKTAVESHTHLSLSRCKFRAVLRLKSRRRSRARRRDLRWLPVHLKVDFSIQVDLFQHIVHMWHTVYGGTADCWTVFILEELTPGSCLGWFIWQCFGHRAVCEQTDKLWMFLSLGRFTNSCAKTCLIHKPPTNQLNQVQCALLIFSVESWAMLEN